MSVLDELGDGPTMSFDTKILYNAVMKGYDITDEHRQAIVALFTQQMTDRSLKVRERQRAQAALAKLDMEQKQMALKLLQIQAGQDSHVVDAEPSTARLPSDPIEDQMDDTIPMVG